MSAVKNASDSAPWRRIITFFAFLLVVDWYLYFWNIHHFFQADTIFLLRYRPTSISELLSSFVELHPSAWFRPLAFDVLEAILFPVLGLNPAGYRIPVYMFFFAVTVAVYVLVFSISNRHLTAGISTFVFNVHTTNAYITYDVGFLPELLYTFFYLIAAISYLRYLQRETSRALKVSVVAFIASLLSKESAVTLPGTLLALHFLAGPSVDADQGQWNLQRITRPLRALRGHMIVLGLYLVFALGYLHVMNVSISSMLNPRPASGEAGSYNFVLGRGMLKNADVAMTWAFNIPREQVTEVRNLNPELISALTVFRASVVGILLVLLITSIYRRIVLAGIAWFFLTILPALPLADHFLPYYLFLPVVGFALLVGVAMTYLHDLLFRVPALAATASAVVLAGLLYVCSVSIHADIRNAGLLGYSSELAHSTLTQLKNLYPVLPRNVFIHIDDLESPLWWHHDKGGLLRMAYNRNDIHALYSSLGQQIPVEIGTEKLILLRYQNGMLIDETSSFQTSPRRFITYKDPENRVLRVSSDMVSVGDSYFLQISGIYNASILITYTLNGGPVEVFGAVLDERGQAGFTISPDTQRGLYQFKGFQVAGEPDWLRSDSRITVQ